jgi:hypothetical protein
MEAGSAPGTVVLVHGGFVDEMPRSVGQTRPFHAGFRASGPFLTLLDEIRAGLRAGCESAAAHGGIPLRLFTSVVLFLRTQWMVQGRNELSSGSLHRIGIKGPPPAHETRSAVSKTTTVFERRTNRVTAGDAACARQFARHGPKASSLIPETRKRKRVVRAGRYRLRRCRTSPLS